MSQQIKQLYEFGPFRLDVRERLLQRDGVTISLTPKAFDLLLVLVERHGRLVEKEELLKLVWPDAFVEEANLTYNISFIRKALGEGENGLKLIETVPKRGYRFVAEVRELEENGAEKARQSDTAKTSASPRLRASLCPRRLLATGLGLLVLMLSLYYLWNKRTAVSMPIKTLAVLPPRPLHINSRDEALELGITSTLITRLSSLRQLTVRSDYAVAKYANLEQDPLAAGVEQKVDVVLDSRYQRSGDKLRFALRLLRVADGATMWADTLDQPTTDSFAIEDALSAKVTGGLKLTLSEADKALLAKRYTRNAEAWLLYTRGRQLVHTRQLPNIEKAITYFERAIRLDQEFALAHAMLGFAYASPAWVGNAPAKEAMPKAKVAYEQALKLDDQLAEAHSFLAQYKHHYEWDFVGAEAEHKRSLELDPNSADVRHNYAFYLSRMGRSEQAIAEIRKAEALEPTSLYISRNVAQILFYARRYDEVIEQSRRVIDLNPDSVAAYVWLPSAYVRKGDEQGAFAAYLKQAEVRKAGTEEIAEMKAAFAAGGLKGYWKIGLDRALEREKSHYVSSHGIAVLYALRGEKEQALARLERAVEERDLSAVALAVDPLWDSYRSNPRFVALVRRVGLMP